MFCSSTAYRYNTRRVCLVLSSLNLSRWWSGFHPWAAYMNLPRRWSHPLQFSDTSAITKARYLRVSRSDRQLSSLLNSQSAQTIPFLLRHRHDARQGFLFCQSPSRLNFLQSHVCRTGSSQAGIGAEGALAGMSLPPSNTSIRPARFVAGMCRGHGRR